MTISGEPPVPGTLVEDITRPGMPGTALLELGWGGEPRDIFTLTDYRDGAYLQAGVFAMKAYQGAIVSMVDDRGTTWSNLHVQRVEIDSVMAVSKLVGGVNGGTPALLLKMRWTLLPVALYL